MENTQQDAWFENTRHVLEIAYLEQSEPWRQSGMSGPEERWVRLRKPVANCIDRDGAFLDIGCANGYLLECCLRWTAEREIRIDPYGVDLSDRLVELARQRLPQYAGHIFSANAYAWEPPRRFDFVRTELVYVPAELEREFVLRLFERYLTPGGKLLVANYGEDLPDPGKGLLPGCFAARKILDHLADLGFQAAGYEDGYDPLKERRVRVAILDHSSLS
jgi:SAM-dependent methyltransferase